MDTAITELVIRINNSGFKIDNIYNLNSIASLKPEIVSIIVAFLQENTDLWKGRENVIRSLARKEAKAVANEALFMEYERAKNKADQLYLWAIGNSIEVIVGDDDFDSIRKIVTNPENGMSRQMFVLALGKIKTQASEDLLIGLLDDKEVQGHALGALRKLKSKKAAEKASLLLSSPNAWIRKEAKKLLDKIG